MHPRSSYLYWRAEGGNGIDAYCNTQLVNSEGSIIPYPCYLIQQAIHSSMNVTSTYMLYTCYTYVPSHLPAKPITAVVIWSSICSLGCDGNGSLWFGMYCHYDSVNVSSRMDEAPLFKRSEGQDACVHSYAPRRDL